MKAVVVHQYGGPEVLKFEEYPDPVPGPGEVLVRGVNRGQTECSPIFRRMEIGERPVCPHIPEDIIGDSEAAIWTNESCLQELVG